MEQQNSRMVAEVNKLIANALIKENGLFLPNLGSLSVESKAPQAKGKGAMVGPSREITFTTEEKHRPLMVIIAEYGNCTPNQAAQIYDKWLEAVKVGDDANIESIGQIQGGVFIAAPEMLERLNPAAKAPLAKGGAAARKGATSRKAAAKSEGGSNGKMIWIALAAVALLAVGYFVFFAGDSSSDVASTEVVEVDAEATAAAAAEKEARDAEILRLAQERAAAQAKRDAASGQGSKGLVAQARESVAEAEKNRPAPTGIKSPSKVDYLKSDRAKNLHPDVAKKVIDGIISRNAGVAKKRYFVVYGVYSSKLNAGRMVVDIMERTQGMGVACGAHLRNGSNYMVTVFESDSFRACNEFIEEKGKKFTDNKIWVLDTTNGQ
ncbi:MAG: hypothetical protein R3Y70_01535 [Rikenellaceae bacterium]